MRLGARFACTTLAFTGLVTFAACGSSGGGGDDDGDDDDTTTPDANTNVSPDADLTGFTELIGRDWTIPPGEQYKCIRIQATEDVYITDFHAQGPIGTHHTVLTVTDNLGFPGGTEIGEYDCEVSNLDLQMLFASGVNTDDLGFPDGVAIKVSAGQYLNLNLHLYNTQPSVDLSGHSGIWVKTIPAAEVEHEAEMFFAGDQELNIPGNTNGTPHEEGYTCTITNPGTIVAYWPHMHQYAVHQKVTFRLDGEEAFVHDEPYSFEEQKNYPFETPIVFDGEGEDTIQVQCFYENDTGQPVGFGDSSDTEMCFTGLYRYPKQATHLFECSNVFQSAF